MRKFGASGMAALLLVLTAVGTALVGACADKQGALMLAIDTDMKAPKDVNAVSVTISTNGAIKHSFIGRVTPQGEVLLPATLAIVEPSDKSASIRIRVMAFQDRKPRVLRDVRTTVPSGGRTALLRIPLNFVNDGSAVGEQLPNGLVPDPIPGTGGVSTGGAPGASDGIGAAGFDFFGAFQPPCADIQNETIIDGACKDNFVDPETLPDFDQGKLGSSTDQGSCFDLAKCFAGATAVGGGASVGEVDAGTDLTADAGGGGGGADRDAEAPVFDAGGAFKDFRPAAVTLDLDTCALQLNGANAARLNIAIVTPDTGECVRPGECYVPLDHGANGWKEENGRVQLPAFVCNLVRGKNLRLATSSEACAAKEVSNPVCTPTANASPGSSTDGSRGGNPLNNCGPSADSCTQEEIAPYNDCVSRACDSVFTQCLGSDWKTGSYTGVCGEFVTCFTKCGCNQTSCIQACPAPSPTCQACLEGAKTCSDSCTEPPCASATKADGGSSGGPTKTCEDLAACCAAIQDAPTKDQCLQAQQAARFDAECAQAYEGFKSFCAGQ